MVNGICFFTLPPPTTASSLLATPVTQPPLQWLLGNGCWAPGSAPGCPSEGEWSQAIVAAEILSERESSGGEDGCSNLSGGSSRGPWLSSSLSE